MVETAGLIVFKKNKVLLVEHLDKADHPTGVYGLPGGRLRKNEKQIDGAKREFKEEAGLKTKVEDLEELPSTYTATIIRKSKRELMRMTVFYCRKYTGSLKKSDETIPKWIRIKKMSSLPLLPNVLDAVKEAWTIYG